MLYYFLCCPDLLFLSRHTSKQHGQQISHCLCCLIFTNFCPEHKLLTCRTTDREGYREYKSCGTVGADCPYLTQCAQSRDHVKTVTRYIWESYMEMWEEIRHPIGMKHLYALRKETIERIFGSAKENHGFRYTQMFGNAHFFYQN